MITLVLAFLGSVVAAAGTGVLAARSIRAPRADLIAWTVAMLGLAVGLGALTLGALMGFGPAVFRAMELGGQVLAPLALCLGLAELAGKSVPARFAGRLLIPALAVIAFAVLSTDTLTPDAVFSKSWPDATVYYEAVSNKLLEFVLAPVTALVAVIAIAVAAWRWAHDPAWRDAAAAIVSGAGAVLALAVPGLIALAGVNFGITVPFGGPAFAVFCVAAAGLTLLAGVRAGRLRLGLLHEGAGDDYDDGWDRDDSWAGMPGQTGDFDPLSVGGEGVYRGNGLYRDDPVHNGDPAAGYPQGSYDLDGFDAGYPGSYASAEPDSGYPEAPAALPPAAGHGARERMFGQIAIYTLLEDRIEDFDQLTEQIVEQVQAREPDTLVYIVHAVPSAPLQRILYEVYRDRAAYEDHRQQPYVVRFEAERRPYVLATNVIELGLQQAKVSPLPSISDILEQTGTNMKAIGSEDLPRPVSGRDRDLDLPGSRPRDPGPRDSGPRDSGSRDPGSRDSGPPGYSPSGYSPPRYGPSGYSPSGYDPLEPGAERAAGGGGSRRQR